VVGRWAKPGSYAVLVASVALTAALVVAVPAEASCVPSEATVRPAVVAAGHRATVSSTTWFGICNDTGQKVDVTDRAVVTFVQGSLRVVLGRTNSDAGGVFRLVVRIPARAAGGPAVLEVRGRSASDDVPITVTAATLPLTGSGSLALLAALVLGTGAVLQKAALPPRR
jgi:hypothetical protein